MSHPRRPIRIAYFISPHGYGHAARACAVMSAVQRLHGAVEFEIYTTVPRWFFEDSLSGAFRYHRVDTDVGFSQKTPLVIDLRMTLLRLDRFYPLDAGLLEKLAGKVRRGGCSLVVCDISPLGFEVARVAGVPSVLIENFTWDWLYEPHAKEAPGLRPHIREIRRIFQAAAYHVQTEPVCGKGAADLVTAPVARKSRNSRSRIRERLGIGRKEKLVLLTMGGTPGKAPALQAMEAQKGVRFVLPGASHGERRRANLILLPRRSDYFHPDLVSASDAVVGKVGYSTLAETYRAGVPFGYIVRKEFRESDVLVSFIESEMQGLEIEEAAFQSGAWVSSLPALLSLPPRAPTDPDGTREIAPFLLGIAES